MRYLDAAAIDSIALGATVLGSGGGGSPEIGRRMAQLALEHAPVQLVSADELDPDALVIAVSSYGSPGVGTERIPSTIEFVNALEAREKDLGRQAQAVMPIEVGGGNSLYPIPVAAARGIPVVDVDAMGRAFPEQGMETFYLDGHPNTPMMMADSAGNVVTIRSSDGSHAERLGRAVTVAMGGVATVCDYALSAAEVYTSGVPHTLTLAEKVGRAILDSSSATDPLDRVLNVTGGFSLISGKVADVERRSTDGFTRGVLEVVGSGLDSGRVVRIDFQNEFLMATETTSGDLLATTPDIIAVLDASSARPITSDAVRYGQRVAVVSIPCFPRWREPDGLRAVGPRYFGYDVDYVPVEVRLEARNA